MSSGEENPTARPPGPTPAPGDRAGGGNRTPGTGRRVRPSSRRHTVQNLFREFNKGPAAGRLRPHDLPARAITLVATATQSVDATAQAMGIDAQTARHDLDAKKAFDGSAILRAAQVARCGTAE